MQSLIVVAGLLVTLGASGQTSEPIIRLDVRQVVVPVRVLDKKRQHVTGLRAADFRLYDDNVAQEILSVGLESDAGMAATLDSVSKAGEKSKPAPPGAPAAKTTYVICFDQLHTSNESFYRSRTALQKLLRKMTASSAQMAVVGLSTSIRVIQPATSDAALLARKLDVESSVNSQQLDFDAAINEVKGRMEQYCGACPCGRSATGLPGDCKSQQEQIRQHLDTISDHFAATTRAFLTGLKAIIEEQGKLGGLTSLIFVSDGFTLLPGKELYAIASAYLPLSGNFATHPPYDLQPEAEAVIKAAVRNNITIETIDSRGVSSPSFAKGGLQDASSAQMGRSAAVNRGGSLYADMDSKWSSVAFDHAGALSQMAAGTGGEFHHNSNDLLRGFEDSVLNGRQYYLLAYKPAHKSEDGAYHAIRVELIANKGSTVRARKGYWD